jgi:hypothetical protein
MGVGPGLAADCPGVCNAAMRFAALVAMVAVHLVTVQAQYYDYSASTDYWMLAFPQCAAPSAELPYVASPVPTPSVADTPSGATSTLPITNVEDHIISLGDPLLVPFVVDAVRGNRVILNAGFINKRLVFNGTVIRLSSVVVVRPAEHLPTGILPFSAAANASVEVQYMWAAGNKTVAIGSQRFMDAEVAVAEDVVVSEPTAPDTALLVKVAKAIRDDAAFVGLTAGESNLGLSRKALWQYAGTLPAPPCTPTSWLIDPALYRVSSPVLQSIPVGVARPAQTAAGDVRGASYVWLAVDVTTRASAFPVDADASWVAELPMDVATSRGGALTNLAESVALQGTVYMLVALTVMAIFGLMLLLLIRWTYRPQHRSTWVNPKHGTQYFGFGPSTLYAKELANTGSDSEGSSEILRGDSVLPAEDEDE